MVGTRPDSRETTPFFEYLNKLRDTIDTAEDKDAVKEAIRSRLYGAQTMRGSEADYPTSSKDEELRDIFRDIQNEDDEDGEMLGKLNEALLPEGGRRRKTKKATRKTKKVKKAAKKTRKSQKYSRRR